MSKWPAKNAAPTVSKATGGNPSPVLAIRRRASSLLGWRLARTRKPLESWLTKTKPEDMIVLFWSGHGFPDPDDPEKVYFACYDTDITVPATGYRMDRVHAAILEVLQLPADAHCPEVWGGLKAAYGPRPGEAPQLVRDVAEALPAG